MVMSNEIVDAVRGQYGAVAASGLSNADAGVRAVAEAFGYSAEELGAIPAGANMGLSCGNPTAMASLREGEVVVDLGSGGGLDVFLAAKRVGPGGRAIGIDMTPEMVERAQKGAVEGGFGNVEFHLATIDRMPLGDGTVDCVVSNCVINLAPDKGAVFREMYRVLKPGGRVAVSDIALKKALPAELATDVMAYVGCIAGAILIEDYVAGLKAAGFEAVHVVDSGADLNAYAKVEGQAGCCSPAMGEKKSVSLTVGATGCCEGEGEEASGCCGPVAVGKTVHEGIADLLTRYDVNEYAASVKVYAAKGK
jgi:SAM-dependent methyltransferase